jgi:spore coat polysaccharide biosynthesis protein SpsF (cytidylyltransferase family)
MKTGILITARLGSTRLGKKHLLPVNNQPLIYYLIERIGREFVKEINANDMQIVIATSDEQENREFEKFSKSGVAVFYGSLNNIPLRHFQAAAGHGLDAIVSIDGDDILCSPKGMREIYRALRRGVQYVKTSDLPFGMNSSGYAVSFLALSIKNHANDTLETGWGRIFNENKLMDIALSFPIQNEALRFTLDYEEDYQFFKALIEKCGDKIIKMTDEEIVNIVLKEEYFRINEPISKQYWGNFYRLQKQEMDKEKAQFTTAEDDKELV